MLRLLIYILYQNIIFVLVFYRTKSENKKKKIIHLVLKTIIIILLLILIIKKANLFFNILLNINLNNILVTNIL